MHLSFYLKFFNLQPHRHLIQLHFSAFLYWKYRIVIYNTHILSNWMSRTFQPNQAPNVASSFVLMHWMPKTFIQNASLNINRIMTESFTQLKDIKLTSFSVPKILWLHLQPVCSKWHQHRTLPNNPHLENKHFTANQPFNLVFPEFFQNFNCCFPLLEGYNANHTTVIRYFAEGTE